MAIDYLTMRWQLTTTYEEKNLGIFLGSVKDFFGSEEFGLADG